MTNPIGALFGRSPIKPIQSHLQKAQGSVELLLELVEHAYSGDWERARELSDSITEAAEDAAEIKRDIRAHLPNSLLLPFARADLLELLRCQDKLTYSSTSIARIVCRRQLLGPNSLRKPLQQHLENCAEATRLALSAINELDELLETGFRGKQVVQVEGQLAKIDVAYQSAVQHSQLLEDSLYGLESELDPVDTLFLYKVIDLVSNFATISQQIGNRLLLLMAH